MKEYPNNTSSLGTVENKYKDRYEEYPDSKTATEKTFEKQEVNEAEYDGPDGADYYEEQERTESRESADVVEGKDVETQTRPGIWSRIGNGVSSVLTSLHLKSPPPSYSWSNWNMNQTTSAKIVVPSTLEELQEVVRTSEKVRVGAFGHSWSPIVATEEDSAKTTLVSTLGQFKRILSTKEEVLRTNKVTMECGVSVQDLEDWLRSEDIPLTVAANVVLTEVYMAGVTASCCHGAGYEWGSVSDFISSISIIGPDGSLTTFTDRPIDTLPITAGTPLYDSIKQVDAETMNHQRGALGLLGVIYALTVDLIPDEVVIMTDHLYPMENLCDPAKLKELVEKHNGWVEIFWVASGKYVWLKTWKRAPKGTKPETPNHAWFDLTNEIITKGMYTVRQKLLVMGLMPEFADRNYISLISNGMCMGYSELGTPQKWRWFEAVHYKNNIHDMRVEDTEYAFPVDDDYKTPAAAWAALKATMDEHAEWGNHPVDIVCEMRFTGGSNASLAHYSANKSKKWVHMEFLSFTNNGIPKLVKRWNKFIHEIASHWHALGGLPHWAKGWHTIHGINNYIGKNVVPDSFRDYRKQQDPTDKFMNTKLAPIFAYQK